MLADLKGKKVAVVGLGISNLALIRFLRTRGVRVVGCDSKDAGSLGEERLQTLRQLGVEELHLGPGYLDGLEEYGVIFLTPGMRKDLPAILEARQRGAVVTSEMDLFFRYCRAKIVGITGSSGKTTTTSLVGAILGRAGERVWVGGNIGQPLIEWVEEIAPQDAVVLELSSFQLQELERSPHIGVVTNVTPNHLDQHRSMEEYIQAKENIVRYQVSGDWAVLNLDNPITRQMAERAGGQVLFFSRTQLPERGAGLIGEDLVWRWAGSVERVLARSEIPLRGEHNVENVLAALAAARLWGAPAEAVREAVVEFKGVPHRLELVREKDGVRYYNDSIATSPARALAGLRSFTEPVVLIAGGYDKHLPFDELAEEVVRRVKALILVGAASPLIEAAVHQAEERLGRLVPLRRCTTFEEAVRAAAEEAKAGDVVLLSPACASYDLFPNFERRGEKFRELVQAL